MGCEVKESGVSPHCNTLQLSQKSPSDDVAEGSEEPPVANKKISMASRSESRAAIQQM